MGHPKVSIVIPTHSHGELIQFPIRSILRQSVQDFEVLVIGDGISDTGRQCVQAFARSDARFRFFDLPKGPRHGELHRHAVLSNEARGSIICYCADDDLLFPTYLEKILSLMHIADFAHPLPVYVTTHGEIGIAAGSLAIDAVKERLLNGDNFNFIGLHGTTHTMELYRRLPFGWRTTPAGVPTDLYMWRQCLSVPGCRAISGGRLLTLHFPDPDRRSFTQDERIAELARWEARILTATDEAGLTAEALSTLAMSRSWELAEKIASSQ